ncbi:MAG: DcrB-related protein [Pseudomonadota bacterium]
MTRTENLLRSDVTSLRAGKVALAAPVPYLFNEGQLGLRVLQERSMHMLTLAQDDGVPLTLSLSRGLKEEAQSLHDCLQQQLQAVAQDAGNFQQQALQPFSLPQAGRMGGGHPRCLVTEVSYQLGDLPVHQGVAVIQLNSQYLLFVSLTHPLGFNEASRQEWHRILGSFIPRETLLPEPGGDLFDDEQ